MAVQTGHLIVDLSKDDASTTTSTPPASLALVPVLDTRLQKTNIRTQPVTKYDNFYTPKNDFFYNNSPYLTLDARRREIRLIRVFWPKTYDQHIKDNPKWAPMDKTTGLPLELTSTTVYNLKKQFPHLASPLIACEIVDKVPLSSMVGCYYALSYCSGKPTETRPVIVDGVPFNTFAALELAIRLVLRYWKSAHPGKESELLLWVDQICINQSDTTERSMQVGLMREIYRRSAETFVSFRTSGIPGTSGTYIEPSTEFVDCLAWTHPYGGCTAAKATPVATIDSQTPTKVDTVKQFLTSCFSSPSIVGVEAVKLWTRSLERFLQSPYWGRAWIYQEFIAGPQIRFLVGSFYTESATPAPAPGSRIYLDHISWDDLSPLLELVCGTFNQLGAFLHAELKDRVLLHQKENEAAVSQNVQEQKQHRQNIADFERQIESKRQALETERSSYVKSLEETINKLDMRADDRWIGKRFLRNKAESYTKYRDRLSKATDLTKEVSELNRTINNKSQSDATRSAARQCLPMVSRLEAIQKEYETLRPSAPTALLEVQKSETALKELEKQKNELVKFEKLVAGYKVSDIWQLAQSKHAYRRPGKHLLTHLQSSRSRKASDPRDRIYAFLGLAERGYDITPDYGSTNTIVHALIDAARRIVKYEKSLGILGHAAQGRGTLGFYLPSWVPDWTSTLLDYDFAAYASTLEKKQQFENDTKAGTRTKPFDAAKGLTMGQIEFRDDEANESNVDLKAKGILVDILDEPDEQPLEGFADLRSFRTIDGLLVIAPKSVILDDEVWVLHGSSMPVVLRPEPEDSYGFVGLCLVCEEDGSPSDIMYGHMIDKYEQGGGDVDLKDIWLV